MTRDIAFGVLLLALVGMGVLHSKHMTLLGERIELLSQQISRTK